MRGERRKDGERKKKKEKKTVLLAHFSSDSRTNEKKTKNEKTEFTVTDKKTGEKSKVPARYT